MRSAKKNDILTIWYFQLWRREAPHNEQTREACSLRVFYIRIDIKKQKILWLTLFVPLKPPSGHESFPHTMPCRHTQTAPLKVKKKKKRSQIYYILSSEYLYIMMFQFIEMTVGYRNAESEMIIYWVVTYIMFSTRRREYWNYKKLVTIQLGNSVILSRKKNRLEKEISMLYTKKKKKKKKKTEWLEMCVCSVCVSATTM